jgi:hypothetical protein
MAAKGGTRRRVCWRSAPVLVPPVVGPEGPLDGTGGGDDPLFVSGMGREEHRGEAVGQGSSTVVGSGGTVAA